VVHQDHADAALVVLYPLFPMIDDRIYKPGGPVLLDSVDIVLLDQFVGQGLDSY